MEWKIEITVKVPENTTKEQVEEWAKFRVGYNGSLKRDNPLMDLAGINVKELEAISCTVRKRF